MRVVEVRVGDPGLLRVAFYECREPGTPPVGQLYETVAPKLEHVAPAVEAWLRDGRFPRGPVPA